MSPFDSAKFQALLEGLEISVVALSQVIQSTSTTRLDPEYFQKVYLHDEVIISNITERFTRFSNKNVRIDASAFYPSIEDDYGTGELPFLRVGDVNGFIDFEQCIRIPEELTDLYPTLARVHPGDIVFTKGGAIDRVGLVTENAAASRDLIFLNTSTLDREEYLFMFAYFQTPIFKRFLVRSSSQTAQPHLTITLVRELPLFTASSILKKQIAYIIDDALTARSAMLEAQKSAERVLLSALGLASWTPPEPLTYTRSIEDVFKVQRLDAQYFMPAKYVVQMELESMSGQLLGQRFTSIRNMFNPSNEPADKWVRNYDVTDALVPILDDNKPPSVAGEIGSVKKSFQYGDVVISRLRAYLRQIAVVRTSDDIAAVGSSEFIVLRPLHSNKPTIAPETLMTFLRSSPVQTILKWCQDGSQHPRFSEADLLSIHVPNVVEMVSPQIEEIVQEGFAARNRAQTLLNRARLAVEIAIEDSETAAFRFLSRAEV